MWPRPKSAVHPLPAAVNVSCRSQNREFPARYYVGSAFGAGGLRARLGHHLAATAEPHWHIDYLLQVANPVEVWYTTADRKLEHHWAEFLEATPHFRAPIPRFGASDYHRSRQSHRPNPGRP